VAHYVPVTIHRRTLTVLMIAGLCVMWLVREGIVWLRGDRFHLGRALFIIVLGSLILVLGSFGQSRGRRDVIPERVQILVGFVVLAGVLALFAFVLRMPLSSASMVTFFGASALTSAIALRHGPYFLVLVPALGGLFGVMASPLLSVLSLNPGVGRWDGFVLGFLMGAAFALPVWFMFRTAGPVGPSTLTIALLIAALFVPWIIATAAVR
jgi:hypothetical protein